MKLPAAACERAIQCSVYVRAQRHKRWQMLIMTGLRQPHSLQVICTSMFLFEQMLTVCKRLWQ